MCRGGRERALPLLLFPIALPVAGLGQWESKSPLSPTFCRIALLLLLSRRAPSPSLAFRSISHNGN